MVGGLLGVFWYFLVDCSYDSYIKARRNRNKSNDHINLYDTYDEVDHINFYSLIAVQLSPSLKEDLETFGELWFLTINACFIWCF